MIKELYILSDFHPELSRGHARGNFSECSGKRSRNRFPAKLLEGIDSFLCKQNKRVSIDSGSDIDNIGAGQVRRNRRRAALIDIDGAGNKSLDRDGCTDLIDGHVEAPLREVAALKSYQQRKTRSSRSGGADFKPVLFRPAEVCRFRRAAFRPA